jgi:hypothetical protein
VRPRARTRSLTRRAPWWAFGRSLGILLSLVVLALAQLPVVHAHAGEEPGLYNAECPLEHLATGSVGVTLDGPGAPDGLPSVPLDLSADTAVPPARRSVHHDARAPPVST